MTNPNTAPSADSDGGAIDDPFSQARLMRWGKALQAEGNSLGDALVAFADSWSQDWAEAVAPEAKPTLQDYQDSVMAMFAAVGYTEEYARQWPKEKVSVTFKRWFDEQISRAAAPPAPPAPLPGKPLTKDQIAALLPLIKAEVDTLSDEGRYTFAGWLPIAVRLIEKHHGIAALSAQAAPEYRTGFDEAPSTFNQEDAAPADYPPQSEIEAIAERLGATDPDDSLWRDFAHAAIDADRALRSGVSADPLPEKLDSQVHDHTDTHIYATIEAACWGEYSVEASRESERDDWYMVVTAPNGIKDYDGTWRRSYNKGLDEVLQQAIEGAMLRAVPSPNLSAMVAAQQHQVKKGEPS